jgi:thymidylate synthase (FAD)
MAHTVEITVHLIAGTQVYEQYVQEWMDRLGVEHYDPDYENKTSAELLTELAGRRCYMSFEPGLNPNVTKIREGIADYIENILKSAHGSVLEHSTYTFAIEGVSRVFTGEMNRHRAGVAISEGSMRYIRFKDMGYWLPPSIQSPPLISPMHIDLDPIENKKFRTRQVFRKAFEDAEKHYADLQEIWKDELAPESKFKLKKEITSMMRRIVPMGIATGGVWTMNLRAMRHIITLRTSPHAEEEIAFVFSNIFRVLSSIEPNIFGDFEKVEGGFYVPKYVKV